MRKILIFLIVVVGCKQKSTKTTKTSLINLSYASTFYLATGTENIKLINTKPWPKATITKEFEIKHPLRRVVCTSSSHLPYIEMLDAEDAVVGFPDAKYISSPSFLQKLVSGAITDLGNGQNLNLELLIKLAPDAVIAFDAGSESNTLDKIEKLGIPVIYNSDFLEESPLGRAEYIKFFGALLNKRERADSIFQKIERDYLKLKEVTSKIESKPTILTGVVYGDTWFSPGGNNWAAAFYKDAGGQYLWENDTTSGWLELSFESVYEKSHNADFWIGTSTIHSKEELLSHDERYASLAPFKKNTVYNYNKIIGPNGGNDFFESGYARPDLVLSDLIKILHPYLLPDYETVYFQKLP